MVCKSPPTNLVDSLRYGVSGVMGYLCYGLRGVRLYQHMVGDLSAIPMHGRDSRHAREGLVDGMLMREPRSLCLNRFKF